MPSSSTVVDNENRRIKNQRKLNASVELVWKAWTQPQLLKEWWGPKGFTNTFQNHEFKEGGQWKFVMHGPNGMNFDNEIIYRKINPLKSINLSHISNPKFDIFASFERVGDQTLVTFDSLFESEKVCSTVKDFAIAANEENFDRLEIVLSGLTGNELPKEFVYEKIFNAPIDQMWNLWTEPSKMALWLGPKDTKVGHQFRF